MRARTEKIGDEQPEEIVVYCHEETPEIHALIDRINKQEKARQIPSFFKGDEQYYLSLREIMFFETDSDRVYAHTLDNTYEVRSRLYELEGTLPDYFVRASRSAIVSILHVFSIKKGLTRVNLISFRQSHKEIYCSRMYSNELFRKMNERYYYDNT